jgi:malate synthase
MSRYPETDLNIQVLGKFHSGFENILTKDALEFISSLHYHFEPKRQELLSQRKERQKKFDNGEFPTFLSDTKEIRESLWTISPIPREVEDRRVEITGPTDRKMMINALNSGASTFMADLEDSTSPTWENVLQGQINLFDAVNKNISFVGDGGKLYQLNANTAVLMVRPRGLHLNERHVLINGNYVSASLFDFGLFVYHNAKTLLKNHTRPYFYLPKMESHLEARWWNHVFSFVENKLNIQKNTIRVTVLIETITAAFEMDEILYELKDYILGLNCGRWDYIFSCIKKLRNHKNFILPNRGLVTMTSPFMNAYSLLTIQTCHKRNAQAIGGMAAQIPIKEDTVKNEEAFQKVFYDKKREVLNGHDGTWVAHPALVPVAKDVFDRFMPGKNQIDKQIDTIITENDLVAFPKGDITEEGLRTNLYVSILYLESWLSGRGAVPIDHLMEDAATAEISRSQIWQWINSRFGRLNDGRDIDISLVKTFMNEEVEKLKHLNLKHLELAKTILEDMIYNKEFSDFLTLESYQYI